MDPNLTPCAWLQIMRFLFEYGVRPSVALGSYVHKKQTTHVQWREPITRQAFRREKYWRSQNLLMDFICIGAGGDYSRCFTFLSPRNRRRRRGGKIIKTRDDTDERKCLKKNYWFYQGFARCISWNLCQWHRISRFASLYCPYHSRFVMLVE